MNEFETLKSKKIAIISSSYPPFKGGGITSAHYNLSRVLINNGYKNVVFTFLDSERDKTKNDEIIRFGLPETIYTMLDNFYYSIVSKLLFRGKIAYQAYGVFRSGIGAILMNLKLSRFNPDFLIVPDHGAPFLFIKKPQNSQAIWISHHNPIRFINNPLLGNYSQRDAKWANKLEEIALKKVDKVICPSNYMLKVFKATYNYNNKIYVVPNLFDEALLIKIKKKDVRDKLGLPKNAFIIFFPSGGSVFKGSRYIAEIIRRSLQIFNYNLGFYISGPIDISLEHELGYLEKHKGAKIFKPGIVSYIDNLSYIKSCSLCVSPTLIESLGMALLESTYLGVPVITFDVGGTSEVIDNGENGYLVPLLDIESLINKLKIINNNEVYANLKNKTGSYTKNKFDQKKIVKIFLEILKD